MTRSTGRPHRVIIVSTTITIFIIGSLYGAGMIYANHPSSNNFFIHLLQKMATISTAYWLGLILLAWVVVTTLLFIFSSRGRQE